MERVILPACFTETVYRSFVEGGKASQGFLEHLDWCCLCQIAIRQLERQKAERQSQEGTMLSEKMAPDSESRSSVRRVMVGCYDLGRVDDLIYDLRQRETGRRFMIGDMVYVGESPPTKGRTVSIYRGFVIGFGADDDGRMLILVAVNRADGNTSKSPRVIAADSAYVAGDMELEQLRNQLSASETSDVCD